MKQLFYITLLLSLFSCRPTTFTPKPPGYFRLDTPQSHTYRVFDEAGFPYTFEYPTYGKIERDSIFFSERADNPYWININFPSLGGMINLTYKKIDSKATYEKLVGDSYGFTFFHHQKADYINSDYFNKGNLSFVLYTVGGNAASRYQFTATDSVKNFILGGLYFDVTPNADSLKPATDFLEKDIEHLLMTLKFR